jgi:hypothetical protein
MDTEVAPKYYSGKGGRKWYYRLKEDPDTPGLLNILSEEERQLLLIIFMVSPEGKRLYTTFEDYTDYIQFYYKELVQPERRCCDEVILEEKRQKIRFDIDAKKEDLLEPQPFLDHLVDCILYVFQQHNITLNVSTDFIWCTSHSETKWSYHLILDNYCCTSSKEVKEWFSQIYFLIDSSHQKFLDTQIYSANHGFRLLGSTKFGEIRIKKFCSEWIYKDQTISYVYPEKIVSPKHQLLLEFDAATVTLVMKCQPLPTLLPEEQKFTPSTPNASEDVVKEAMDLCRQKNHDVFKFKKTMGNLVLLERTKEAHCIICHTVHERTEPFLVIKSNGQVWFDCRRSQGKRELLGNINMVTLPEKKLDTQKLLKLAKLENKKLYS